MKAIDLLQQNLNPGKTLVYFASGKTIKEEYCSLPYSNIILVDYGFKNHQLVQDKVFCLKMDCLAAVKLFKILNISIDCFVCINEGLGEGGASYPINSDNFIGYCSQILNSPLIHIGQPGYYQGEDIHYRKHYLDIPFENKIELNDSSPAYIDPKMFSTGYSYRNGKVHQITFETKTPRKITFNNVTINIKHRSIWDDQFMLDGLFLNIRENAIRENLELFEEKIYFFRNQHSRHCNEKRWYAFSEVIALCTSKKLDKIGLVPHRGDYLEEVNEFKNNPSEYPKEVTYYHLNKGDYKDLCALAEA